VPFARYRGQGDGASADPTSNPASPATLVPIAAAIGVFGMLYGAAAQPLFGTWLTLFSSVVIFSGTVQFSMVGLLAASAGPVAVLWAVFVVNIRNFALGAALRPHLLGGDLRRLLVSWFLIDETVGLALAAPWHADRTLLRSGLVAYLAWVSGTAIGVAGGAVVALQGLASAVFPVLFVGLAALMVRSASGLARAGVGAAVTLVLLFIWPGLAGLAPILGGVVAALPGGGGE
jgi:predicted branched-subunit amino acid permease